MTDKPERSPILSLPSTWEEKAGRVWFASVIRLYRNYTDFKFPGKLSVADRTQVFDLARQGLESCSLLGSVRTAPAESCSPVEKEFLLEHFLMKDSIHRADKGEGFVLDDSGRFCGVVNLRNHVQLHHLDFEGKLEEALNHVFAIESHLGSQLSFAFCSKFGYLTADPGRCGTGLDLTAHLHVPALVHTGKLKPLIADLLHQGVFAVGLQGDPEDLIGDILLLSNSYSLGVKEEQILAAVRKAALSLQTAEVTCRQELMQGGNHAELKDAISRALGLALHSYQLTTVEALHALSLMRLGAALGWVSGLEESRANRAFFSCRRAHLLQAIQEEVPRDAQAKARAAFVHEWIDGASFTG